MLTNSGISLFRIKHDATRSVEAVAVDPKHPTILPNSRVTSGDPIV